MGYGHRAGGTRVGQKEIQAVWTKKGQLSGSSLNAAQALCIDTEALFITRAPDLSRASEGTLISHFYGGQKVKLIIRHHLRSTDVDKHSQVVGSVCISCIPRLARSTLGPSLVPARSCECTFRRVCTPYSTPKLRLQADWSARDAA